MSLTHAQWCQNLAEDGVLDADHRKCLTSDRCMASHKYTVEQARKSTDDG